MTVIVISGQPVCGSSSSARLLAERLRLRHFSAGDFFKSFSQKGTETEKATLFMKTDKGSSSAFHNALEKRVADECRKGDVVIDTKLGIRMQKGLYDFSVWLKAPFPVRADRVAERDALKGEDAEAALKEKEEMERATWKRIYGFDYFDQEFEADLIIDNSDLSKEETVEKIMEELGKRGII